jgi:hypothetical protein
MDITNPAFREAAQRVIVAPIDHVKDHPSVIGYQLDSETKSCDISGPNVQDALAKSMRFDPKRGFDTKCGSGSKLWWQRRDLNAQSPAGRQGILTNRPNTVGEVTEETTTIDSEQLVITFLNGV